MDMQELDSDILKVNLGAGIKDAENYLKVAEIDAKTTKNWLTHAGT